MVTKANLSNLDAESGGPDTTLLESRSRSFSSERGKSGEGLLSSKATRTPETGLFERSHVEEELNMPSSNSSNNTTSSYS
jgi:hypothetical protein